MRSRVFACLFLLATLASAQETGHQFQYDEAGNLLSESQSIDGAEATLAMPLDSSGRNRPSAVGDVPLVYDANGNLTAKGPLRFGYDFRNRLTEVKTETGALLVRYVYDVGNRRIQEIIGSDVFETRWSNWQPIEVLRNGLLESRLTYGRGLDEVVVLERDLDDDGVLDASYVPIYDHTGNLALMTSEDGTPIERYTYSPYGSRTITVDLTAPAVEQVRVVGDELWIEISEAILSDVLTEGSPLVVEVNEEPPALTSTLSVVDGRLLKRRIVVSFDGGPPRDGDTVVLRIEPSAIVDFFHNALQDTFEQSFLWPVGDVVLFDGAAVQLDTVMLRDGFVELAFSEEIDLATSSAITIDDLALSWTLDESRYRLVSTETLTEGTHELYVVTELADLAQTTLQAPIAITLVVPEEPVTASWYRRADERVVGESTIANRIGFHGRPHDAITGFVYMRNRYYDPEIGRFITPDPLGYTDGPSMYQAFANSPYNYTDPYGLEDFRMHPCIGRWGAERDACEREQAIKLADRRVVATELGRTAYQMGMGALRSIPGALAYIGARGSHHPMVTDYSRYGALPMQNREQEAGALAFGLSLGLVPRRMSPGRVNPVGTQKTFGPRGGPTVPSPEVALYYETGVWTGPRSVGLPPSARPQNVSPRSTRVSLPARESQLRHIFRDAPGHLPNTPANRVLLQQVADDVTTVLGTDRFGNAWSARTRADGSQIWVQVRNGVIQNGGVNATPRTFNVETGLAGGGS